MQVAVVTGASSGIGAALARAARARGWHCVLLARREERLRALAEELGGEYELCDVADREQVEAVAARVLERHPRIDLLVNNAGVAARGGFLERRPGADRVGHATSTTSARSGPARVPARARGGAPADVVNIVSVAGRVACRGGPTPRRSTRSSRSPARSPASSRRAASRVHTVNPGFVETEGFPQRTTSAPLLRRLVVDPPFVAERIMRAVELDQREIVVPRWYRIARARTGARAGARHPRAGALCATLARRA